MILLFACLVTPEVEAPDCYKVHDYICPRNGLRVESCRDDAGCWYQTEDSPVYYFDCSTEQDRSAIYKITDWCREEG